MEPARPKVGRSLSSLAVVRPDGRASFLAPRVGGREGMEGARRQRVRVRTGRAMVGGGGLVRMIWQWRVFEVRSECSDGESSVLNALVKLRSV